MIIQKAATDHKAAAQTGRRSLSLPGRRIRQLGCACLCARAQMQGKDGSLQIDAGLLHLRMLLCARLRIVLLNAGWPLPVECGPAVQHAHPAPGHPLLHPRAPEGHRHPQGHQWGRLEPAPAPPQVHFYRSWISGGHLDRSISTLACLGQSRPVNLHRTATGQPDLRQGSKAIMLAGSQLTGAACYSWRSVLAVCSGQQRPPS